MCNNLRDNDYKHGGLGRCSEERAAKELYDRMTIYLYVTSNRFLQRSNYVIQNLH